MPFSALDAQPSVLRAIIEDARWETHAGPAPRTATAPFVVFWEVEPAATIRAQCREDWGRIDTRYRLLCFHATPAQARWLFDQVADKFAPHPEWEAELPVEPLFEETTDDPPLWVRPLTVKLTPT